jgi:benzoate/toluate 1,2-dioxygenase beta subunit/2,4,5-trichlorophenoxyacetic acid oxygenase 2
MLDIQSQAIAARILALEGLYLDRQEWDNWLALYADDVVYWVPAWRNESQLVEDVRREVSLIYHSSRAGLDERVLRIRSRKSVTAMPMPRTAHSVSNVLVHAALAGSIEGTASWVVHAYDPRVARTNVHFGLYEFALRQAGTEWKIVRKKIMLQNDLIPTLIDFYNL